VGKTGVVQLLENLGASTKKRDDAGRTAADWARTQEFPSR
jgi:hypothetical protein